MEKKWATITLIILLLVFTGYIVVDTSLKKDSGKGGQANTDNLALPDKWVVKKVFEPGKGRTNAVTVSADSRIIIGGDSSIACYDPDFKLLWENFKEAPISALAFSGNTVYAASGGLIFVMDQNGKKIDEWGPFEEHTYITSLSSNELYVAFADAVNKTVFILDKRGVVKNIIGKPDASFVIPSPFFDIALSNDNSLYVANTGNKRIEKRNIDGTIQGFFGESGSDPDEFCGCCNPAHFALIPDGFITAEKGINRLKILDQKGEFVEFVSSVNDFKASVPLDVVSFDGNLIFAANPSDSKIYVFERK